MKKQVARVLLAASAGFLMLGVFVPAPIAVAQTDSGAQPDAQEQQPESDPLENAGAESEDESPADEAEAAADATPEQVQATLERFVPSEQISEDNSVAYPNDI